MSQYARYPATSATIGGTVNVQGTGTAGTAATGVVTVQGIAGGTVVPVSGTVTATNASIGTTGAAAPASATQVGGSDGTTLRALLVSATGVVSVDGSAVTQPISAASLPLPTGAATLAKQPALGTAGTASADVITVQGIASMTPLLVNGSGATQPISGTVTANAGTGTFTTTIASTTAAFQAEANVAFGSITNSYVTIFTPSAATKILQMRNNMNAAVSVSFDAGSTTNYILDAGDQVSLDLLANTLVMSTTAIQVKYTVGAPTSGSFRINGCH